MAENKSRMEKAEGDRETALRNEGVDTRTDDRTNEGATHPGITNRTDEEESSNQQRVPPRGDSKGGA